MTEPFARLDFCNSSLQKEILDRKRREDSPKRLSLIPTLFVPLVLRIGRGGAGAGGNEGVQGRESVQRRDSISRMSSPDTGSVQQDAMTGRRRRRGEGEGVPLHGPWVRLQIRSVVPLGNKQKIAPEK